MFFHQGNSTYNKFCSSFLCLPYKERKKEKSPLPVNDPSGFAPDLYDVDWAALKNIEVSKGLFASLYGSSGTGGVINITTRNGGLKPVGGEISQGLGSNGFSKTFLQLDGSKEMVDYRVSFRIAAEMAIATIRPSGVINYMKKSILIRHRN